MFLLCVFLYFVFSCLFLCEFVFFFFFFFQAEDGIRDWSVTGVQTCALPISTRSRSSTSFIAPLLPAGRCGSRLLIPVSQIPHIVVPAAKTRFEPVRHRQIGRASCRERV